MIFIFPLSDGFSAGGRNLLFENNQIQNGDDCVTIGNGARDVVFKLSSPINGYIVSGIVRCSPLVVPSRNSRCEGGHGLSVGSLGKNGQVADVQNVMCASLL